MTNTTTATDHIAAIRDHLERVDNDPRHAGHPWIMLKRAGVRDLLDRLAAMEAALAWYAEPTRYGMDDEAGDGAWYFSPGEVDEDGGARARAALEHAPKEPTP